ncbi:MULTISPECIES: nitroreductase/quinone reductase family protein [Streptosporangium]|uniref:Deazaflavin-dependent oxidoreductase (Nitroreductase family) n=1 Tax=Streptosporangium brasiliense TaxID=47480 RepID=A0ABT9RFA7_9ACTN|nr:nitroreductase/quinone reductase family protein [Streptosporangium brasiliense]MDP9867972.1 deazaflavin-dependent oxidoreductase (nitroreductase family) [Streptosporangium brasiliense]
MSKEQAETWAGFDVNELQRQVIAEFRANNGKMSGMFEGWTLAVLTTVGAKSGLRRESILGYLEFAGKGIIVASSNGADKHPAWYHNIRKNPIVTVETGSDTYQAIAAIPPAQERDKLFDRVIAEAPGYADHQARTAREIPVVVLHRIGPKPGEERVKGMGDWIVEVHDWLRKELETLRAQADRAIEGGMDTIERTPPDLAQQMRTHCLNFCGALKKHHSGEDTAVFPMLAKQFPALAPALAQLGEEHKVVARLQDDIQQLVDSFVPGETDSVQLRADLERLADQLESHFRYEEETIVTALNAMAPAPEFG